MRDISIEEYGENGRVKLNIGLIVLVFDEDELKDLERTIARHRGTLAKTGPWRRDR
jgi:hypothetical protein